MGSKLYTVGKKTIIYGIFIGILLVSHIIDLRHSNRNNQYCDVQQLSETEIQKKEKPLGECLNHLTPVKLNKCSLSIMSPMNIFSIQSLHNLFINSTNCVGFHCSECNDTRLSFKIRPNHITKRLAWTPHFTQNQSPIVVIAFKYHKTIPIKIVTLQFIKRFIIIPAMDPLSILAGHTSNIQTSDHVNASIVQIYHPTTAHINDSNDGQHHSM